MQIVPSIDIIGGKCVRLLKGEFGKQTTYAPSPVEVAEKYASAGARSLHIVDLDGAKERRVTNWEVLKELLALPAVDVQVGGGIRTDQEIDRLLRFGAARVVVGSVAVKTPEQVGLWSEKYGPDRICVALDLKGNRLAYEGWLESSTKGIQEVVMAMEAYGINRFLSTDINKDGTLEGPNIGLYSSLVRQFPKSRWYASGGVQSLEDVKSLKSTGVFGVIIGKALFEGALRIEELLEVAC